MAGARVVEKQSFEVVNRRQNVRGKSVKRNRRDKISDVMPNQGELKRCAENRETWTLSLP